MDVNNTRFHLLLGKADWAPLLPGRHAPPEGGGPACGAAWDEERSCVRLQPLLYRFPKPEQLGFADRRGAARDRYGNWYTIDEDATGILFLPTGGRQTQRFWPTGTAAPSGEVAGPFRPLPAEASPASLALRGLAVTTHHYLVVGVLEPPGLLLFDLHAGGAPVQMGWPGPFHPFDLAPRPEGGVWILGGTPAGVPGAAPAAPRYWALDRYFRIESPDAAGPAAASPPKLFQPLGGGSGPEAACLPPAAPSSEQGLPLDLRNPVALEGLPDDTVLLLDVDPASGETRVGRYDFGQPRGSAALRPLLQAELALAADEKSGNLGTWQGYDLAFVAEEGGAAPVVRGTLYVVGRDGNQAFAFRLRAEGEALTLSLRDRYLPLRRFDGKGLVATGGTPYYDLEDRWLPLVAQPKPRYCPAGTLETGSFDSRLPDCVWHRLLLDACLPSGTEVRVESRAANDEELLERAPWREEPRLYRRGSGAELPYYHPFAPEERRRDGLGTWELLFQRAGGRYLQLRLTLHGTGRSTPRLYALRAYYPRFSYLKEYLPDLYREEEVSASFLDRYLANAEGLFTELEGRIAEVQHLFDERIAGDEYLDWLASWLGVVLDPAYSEQKRRLFVRHAHTLFRQRGTLAGLVRAVRLALDPCPDDTLFEPAGIAFDAGYGLGKADARVARFGVRLVERFLTRRTPGVAYGDATDLPGPRLTRLAEPWTPNQGPELLHEHYRAFLEQHYAQAGQEPWWDDLDAVRLSPVLPAESRQRDDWRQFIRNELDFTYAEVTSGDAASYRSFLARRYRQIERLNTAYGRAYAGFDAVTLPGEGDFPKQNPRLRDWIQFVSLALPIRRSAHQFIVLVPTEPESDLIQQEQRLALVRRIIEAQKPAHTAFEVKPYWALFRVGAVRVGFDTLLHEGSRYVALLLGQSYLASGHVASAHPWDAADRIVTGRDQPGAAL